MKKNKDFIICFPQAGFQLTPEDDLFESRLVLNYQDVGEVKKKIQFESKSETINATIQPADTQAITDAVFDLKPIYPNDLNAKSFSKLYANGAVKFEVDLKDGLKHGRYVEYYPNGEEKITGRFRNDKQVGTWRYYDQEGESLLKKRF
jgi:antitoxin component YwqK of YwqJK toxin-antitoxin module